MSQALISSRGFLPEADPIASLPSGFDAWESIGRDLPRLLVSGKVRAAVRGMGELDPQALQSPAEVRRAMLLLSFMAHAYVWGETPPADVLPSALARPWHAVATRLGRPPVLSYASYALDNFRRLDARGSVELGNLALLQHFLGGADEEWFITVHVDIEARAALALHALAPLLVAVQAEDFESVERQLTVVAASLEAMVQSLSRIPEWCDPYVYFTRVRPFIFGWKDQPALPRGMIYEGVAAYAGRPQLFRGETGAQSSIVPCLDAVLGVRHHADPLRRYLLEMRDYMPPEHRNFIAMLEQQPGLSNLVEARRSSQPGVREAFNACLFHLQEFRSKHLEFAARYIHRQSQSAATNPTSLGTGGTPFMRYLQKHRDETSASHVSEGGSVRPA